MSQLQKLSDVETTQLGAAAGLVEVTIMQPTIYLKNSAQQGIVPKLDPRYFYRGYLASATNMAALTGLQFLICGMTQKWFTGGKQRDLTLAESCWAGFAGGAGSGPLCCLLELTMIQQQRFGGNFLGTPTKLVAQEGIMSLTRGLVGASLREGLYTAGFLGLNPFLVNWAEKNEVPYGRIFAPLASALIAGSSSHPIDTIKTCMQGDVQRNKYGSFMNTTRTIYAERGLIKGFFAGWFWRVPGRQVLSFFILQEARIGLAPMLFPEKCGTD